MIGKDNRAATCILVGGRKLIPLTASEQRNAKVVLLGTFPGADVLVRSHLAKREKSGDSLLVSGSPKLIEPDLLDP